MHRKFRKLPLKLVIGYLVFWVSIAPAATRDLSEMLKLPESTRSLPRGSVYVYGDPSLDTLIPVRVMGAVEKAGIHFVPPNTDLLTLLSLAGGPSKEANLNDVTIRRSVKGETRVLTANLETMLTAKDAPLPLMSDDTILVPSEKNLLSDDTIRTVGFVASLATIVMSIALANNAFRSK